MVKVMDENMNIDQEISAETVDLSHTPFQTIQILAQPDQYYHARYRSDIAVEKQRTLRYIRSKDGTFCYPTIKIPSSWCNMNKKFYVRVCLVTVLNINNDIRYIHPYSLEVPPTLNGEIIQNLQQNALYFPVTEVDVIADGIKRFNQLILVKQLQNELKTYGPLRAFDINDGSSTNNERLFHGPKELISYYELYKLQLAFTITEKLDSNSSSPPSFLIHKETTTFSIIMIEDTVQSNKSNENKFIHDLCESLHDLISDNDATSLFKCTRLLIHRHDKNLLEKAIINGHLTLAKQMIKALKIDTLKRQNEYGENVLLLAAKLNYKDLVETVLERHVELVYDSDKRKNNVFHLLAIKDDKSCETIEFILKYLQQKAINIKQFDQENIDHLTPLQLASLNNNSSCVNTFVSHGFKFNTKNG
ncbi:unnamed protein product [Didymodactylos carnosus]|uniref:Uncharacterized protein n=1 Tax=Didymodactylos carnosus TaxID=1234261 RepID=A0A815GAX0_9BILA|nr:unnamed protein product [Didymodactylos carnosus]CAF4194877.1 unnamed protein product [Didymodactylos carnosus]